MRVLAVCLIVPFGTMRLVVILLSVGVTTVTTVWSAFEECDPRELRELPSCEGDSAVQGIEQGGFVASVSASCARAVCKHPNGHLNQLLPRSPTLC